MRFLLIGLLFFFGFKQELKEIHHSVYFGGGSYGIDNEQIAELVKIINSLKNKEHWQVRITSHTDNIGSQVFNERLSRLHSQAVIDIILSNGVEEGQIRFKDFGLLAPVFNNDTHQGRIKNRRVDILFMPIVL